MDDQTWATPLPAVAIAALAALGLGAWAFVASDAPGRLLVGLAALALAAAALHGGLARPRLAARAEGLVLRGALGARSWPWARVDAVRSVRMRRLGLPGAYVEVDARDDDGRERLLVLGRLELGTDPVEVADALQRHRAAAGRTSAQGGGAQDVGEQQHDHDAGGDGEPGGRA